MLSEARTRELWDALQDKIDECHKAFGKATPDQLSKLVHKITARPDELFMLGTMAGVMLFDNNISDERKASCQKNENTLQ